MHLLGENIKIRRFERFVLGDGLESKEIMILLMKYGKIIQDT